MHRFRAAHFLVRLVLAWFALSLGVAIASPVIQPKAMELVCSSAGAIKLLIKTDGGQVEVQAHAQDCPLCAGGGAPPPAVRCMAEPAQPLAHDCNSIAAAHIAWLTSAPLPARGPPLL